MTSSSNSTSDICYEAVGIGLVVETAGRGAKLALRYPSAPAKQSPEDVSSSSRQQHTSSLPTTEKSSSGNSSSGGDRKGSSSSSAASSDNVFFSLPSRVMAKLFRLKDPHCGRPISLAVGNTVFCCRAVLFEEKEKDESDQNDDSLVLFSVIVALTASSHTRIRDTSSHSSDSRRPQFSGGSALERCLHTMHRHTSFLSMPSFGTEPDYSAKSTSSSSLKSIRSVHMSLSRLCRVLEREEKRCNYVSRQFSMLLKIRDEHGHKLSPTGTSPASARRASNSLPTSPADHPRDNDNRSDRRGDRCNAESEMERFKRMEETQQEITEIMLAASPPISNDRHAQHHGNLARELAQVFHALSRNDACFLPTPTSLLTKKEGIVYVNAHIAVPIEPLTPDAPSSSSLAYHPSVPQSPDFATKTPNSIRSYHTLLFPHASPEEFLRSLPSPLDASQQLPKLLLMANPHKPLSDIALDAALPLPTALHIASRLVQTTMCTVSPVISRATRFACNDNAMTHIPRLALPFHHRFGTNIPIFLAVNALTADCTSSFGTVLTNLSKHEIYDLIVSSLPNKQTIMMRQNDTRRVVTQSSSFDHAPPTSLPPPPPSTQPPSVINRRGVDFFASLRGDPVRNRMCSMAVWLRAQNVIVEMKDYFVAIGGAGRIHQDGNGGDGSKDADGKQTICEEELLFEELLVAGCLNGKISTMALCWRMGVDMRRLNRLRDWGLRERRMEVVTRIPMAGDDWGAP